MLPSGQLATGWLREPNDRDTVVVFVHGIISGGIQCWSDDHGVYWPALLAQDGTLKDIGVFVFSYRTSLFSKTYSVSDVVKSLKETIQLRDIHQFKKIIFVAHSLGGIVVRRFLVANQADLISQGAVIGLFMVASPSLGSVHANLLYPLIGLARNTQAKILRFHQQNLWLNDLDDDFIKLKDRGELPIRGKELVEDIPLLVFKYRFLRLRLFRQTVPPYSAARYFPDYFKVEGSDHSTIAKPATSASIQHELLVKFIKELIKWAGTRTSMFIPSGWTFEDAAKVLVEGDWDNGSLVIDKGMTKQEREAAMMETTIEFDSIVEGLGQLRGLTNPEIRGYRVEHVEREYRLKLD
jgi:pimeloyl-ACP methyl ester carboxylesterase